MIAKYIPKLNRKDWLALLILTLVYFGLTTFRLTNFPIFVDESIYTRWAQIGAYDAQWRFISLTDGKQPLFMWLAMPLIRLVSDPLWATRFVSVLAGYLTVLGAWYAGWLLGKKKMAYPAAIFSLFSPFAFFYHRFAVVESLLAATGIWIWNLSYLLALTLRLDIALLLGLVTGASLLVKSPAMFYFLLIPTSYVLVFSWKKLFSKQTLRYLILVIIAWGLAQGINNIQRLSPWMYRISQKNEFFVVPYNQIFSQPARIWLQFKLAWKWFAYYNTLPIFLFAVFGWFLFSLKFKFKSLILNAWFWGPLIAEVLIARLFAPRYIFFLNTFLLLFAAYPFTRIKNRRWYLFFLLSLLIVPSLHIWTLLTKPTTYKFVSEDSAYIDGWSSGQGMKELASYLKSRAETSGKEVFVGTEGTFGILPYALQLYTYNVPHLTIKGYWPVTSTPPKEVYQLAQDPHYEVYFVYNNTQLTQLPPKSQLIKEYKKRSDFWLRLYRIQP